MVTGTQNGPFLLAICAHNCVNYSQLGSYILLLLINVHGLQIALRAITVAAHIRSVTQNLTNYLTIVSTATCAPPPQNTASRFLCIARKLPRNNWTVLHFYGYMAISSLKWS